MLKVTQEIKVSTNTLKCFLAMQLYTNFQETSGQMQPSKDFLRNEFCESMSVTSCFGLQPLLPQFGELHENQPYPCDLRSIITSLIKCMRGHLSFHFLEH